MSQEFAPYRGGVQPDAATAGSTFPSDFVWGAAAASYQIEGAVHDDGKGPSDWDVFTRKPGAIFEGHTGEVACDHYHRYAEDVALMGELGLGAYRLSISWPRVLPEGRGAVNERGLAFYDRLIDALLERGIQPWITLFHWDYPLALFRQGGWLNRDSADWFADYVSVVADRLSDRVKHFITLNEPQVYIGFGHQEGRHAPGLTLPLPEVLRAGHHTLLAHGKAVQALRARGKQVLSIGYAPVGMPKMPLTEEASALELARRATFDITERNAWNNAWWMDPVYLGEYPEQGLAFYGASAPPVRDGDLATIHQPLDFFGVNIYEGRYVRKAPGALGYERLEEGLPGCPRTAFNWQITPEALYYGPKFFFERYRLPIVVTENGLSCRDWVALDGGVHDAERIDFMTRYLREYRRASQAGVRTRGYFHWSILDNFEWSAGYRERFGLVHVDYQTQARTPKDSCAFYQKVIASNGALLG